MAHVRARPRPALAALAIVVMAVAVALITRSSPAPDVLPPAPDEPAGMRDLWSGHASLVLDRTWTSTSLGMPQGGGYAGAQVVIVGDRWYLFNRRTDAGDCAGKGPGAKPMATLVRGSTDGGRTWGPPAAAVQPTPGTPWSCAATDGGAVYDARADVWRVLFQCLGEAPGWYGCYAEREGPDPVGPFTAPAGMNPVISPGDLWDRICADDRCGAAPVADEGTFDVFSRDGPSWWVGFHGYDGQHGYRGLAKTQTFVRGDWEAGGASGTPDGPVVGPADAEDWREDWHAGGPIGAGAARILEDDGAFYQLVEVPDLDLACTSDQNWDLGLLRTTELGSTRWEQFPGGNPIVYSSRQPEPDGKAAYCNVEYPGLFRDAGGVTYLMHGRISSDPALDGIYVYRVAWDRNLLRNGSLWRANGDGWTPLSGSGVQMSVERTPDQSPDGTPWLAVACGAEGCNGQQAVYQDVRVDTGDAGGRLAFGGSIRADAGGARVQLAVLQLDDRGSVVTSSTLPADVGTTYASLRGSLAVDGRARTLRFQIVPQTPGRIRADNLYVIPQAGCEAPSYPTC
jgi:hypothetical protein